MDTQPSILLVEDDQFTARMMELQLVRNGMSVTLTENGTTALACLDSARFDLVLTDMVMPGMTGTELVTRIRQNHPKETLPVLVITGLDNTEIVRKALDAGANDFIPKTGEFGVILARVKHFLAESKQDTHPLGPLDVRRSDDGLWNWNITTNEIYFSPRWKAILGFGADELSKSPQEWFGRIHPKDADQVTEGIEAHLKRREAFFQMDYRICCKDKEYRWVHSFGVALFGKDGNPKRMLGPMCAIEDGDYRANVKKQTNALGIELKNLANHLPADSPGRPHLERVFNRYAELEKLLLDKK